MLGNLDNAIESGPLGTFVVVAVLMIVAFVGVVLPDALAALAEAGLDAGFARGQSRVGRNGPVPTAAG